MTKSRHMTPNDYGFEEDRPRAIEAAHKKLITTFRLKVDKPVDDDWHSAFVGAEEGDAEELVRAIKTYEVTQFARLVLADLIDRKISKRPDKPKRANFLTLYVFDGNLERALAFVEFREERLEAALLEAKIAKRQREEEHRKLLADLIPVAAKMFMVGQKKLRNGIKSKHQSGARVPKR